MAESPVTEKLGHAERVEDELARDVERAFLEVQLGRRIEAQLELGRRQGSRIGDERARGDPPVLACSPSSTLAFAVTVPWLRVMPPL